MQHRLQLVLGLGPLLPERDPQPRQKPRLLRPSFAIQASGSRSARDRCASVAESTLSFFSRADAIALTRCGCTITSLIRLRLDRSRKRRPEPARLHHYLPRTRQLPQPRPQRRSLVDHLHCFNVFPLASTAVK